jgi:hypothetical protein
MLGMPILSELRGRTITVHEYMELARPACLTCGTTVLLKVRYAGVFDDLDRWTIVDWSCPSGCGHGSGGDHRETIPTPNCVRSDS